MLNKIIFWIIGLGSGVVIAGAVFAFIAVIGVVPRLAQKTNTSKYMMLYEEAIILGGIFGTTTLMFDYYIPLGKLLTVLISFIIGIFYGCLAMSLAEVLNAIPIIARRGKLAKGITVFVTAFALGKFTGSFLYFTIAGFFEK